MTHRETRIIALANQKGGVGKSTTSINLAAALAYQGQKILLVDLDPQGNATSGLGIDRSSVEQSVYEVLLEDVPVEYVVEPNSGIFSYCRPPSTSQVPKSPSCRPFLGSSG